MKNLYTAHATTVAGREGFSETDDKQISIKLSKPGSGKPGSNPEQLFACGYSALQVFINFCCLRLLDFKRKLIDTGFRIIAQ